MVRHQVRVSNHVKVGNVMKKASEVDQIIFGSFLRDKNHLGMWQKYAFTSNILNKFYITQKQNLYTIKSNKSISKSCYSVICGDEALVDIVIPRGYSSWSSCLVLALIINKELDIYFVKCELKRPRGTTQLMLIKYVSH